jgi:hypothetical protein
MSHLHLHLQPKVMPCPVSLFFASCLVSRLVLSLPCLCQSCLCPYPCPHVLDRNEYFPSINLMLEPKYLVQFEEGVNIAAVVGCDVVNRSHIVSYQYCPRLSTIVLVFSYLVLILVFIFFFVSSFLCLFCLVLSCLPCLALLLPRVFI